MAIVGAFLGGPGTTIPVGSGIMELQWVTSDGLNQTVSYQITGPETKTLQSDSNGYVAEMVTAGTYTVTPIHDGEYSGDDPKIVTVPNRNAVSVVWFGSRVYQQQVNILAGRAYPQCTYVIRSEGDVQIETGSIASSKISTYLYPGDYTILLTMYGCTTSRAFSVANSTMDVDISDMFVNIGVSMSTGPFPTSYNGSSVGSVSSFYVLKEDVSRVISVESPTYGGVNTSPVMDISDVSVVPSQDRTVSITALGTIVLLTEDGDLNVPVAGKYSLLVIGGGGGGGQYGIGGSGGNVSYGTNNLEAKKYTITIGAPGNVSSSYGGSTSFGTVRSASGYNSNGGGSGGGGGGTNAARSGSFGGGGGGAQYDNAGGSGGSHGGKGGNMSSDGSNGVSASNDGGAGYSTISPTGGTAGTEYSYSYKGGGGGGGGYGAKGGNGGNASSRGGGGGGGGGGIAGGNGGNGGSGSGSPGLGYGAGGRGSSYANRGGGGGGGGYGSAQIASGTTGAKGCVVIRWLE